MRAAISKLKAAWFLAGLLGATVTTGWAANTYLSRYATAQEQTRIGTQVEDHGRRLERLEERVDANLEWIRRTLDRIAEKQGVPTH